MNQQELTAHEQEMKEKIKAQLRIIEKREIQLQYMDPTCNLLKYVMKPGDDEEEFAKAILENNGPPGAISQALILHAAAILSGKMYQHLKELTSRQVLLQKKEMEENMRTLSKLVAGAKNDVRLDRMRTSAEQILNQSRDKLGVDSFIKKWGPTEKKLTSGQRHALALRKYNSALIYEKDLLISGDE